MDEKGCRRAALFTHEARRAFCLPTMEWNAVGRMPTLRHCRLCGMLVFDAATDTAAGFDRMEHRHQAPQDASLSLRSAMAGADPLQAASPASSACISLPTALAVVSTVAASRGRMSCPLIEKESS